MKRFGLLLACALCGVTGIARAQGEGASPSVPEPAPQSAVQLGRLGLERFEQGAFAESFDLFSRAEALKHSPVFVLYMARSARHLGRLLESRNLLRRAASEAVPEGSPASWQQARADARGELTALEPRIPSFRVRIEGDATGVSVTADGNPTTAGTSIERDPGSVTIRATRPSGDPFEKVVLLKEGDRDTQIVIDFATRTAAAPPVTEPSDESEGGGTYLPGAIVLGAGSAGLVIGSIFGLVAASQSGDALAPCSDDGVCPTSQKGAIDDAKAPADIATVAFIAGAALSATGVVLLVVLGGDDDPSAARLELSPTHLRASTTF